MSDTQSQQFINECNPHKHLHPCTKQQSEVEQFVINEGEAEAAGEDELGIWYNDPAPAASLEQTPTAPTQFDIDGTHEQGDREGDMPAGKAAGR
eukprot:12531306-Alexandrium_andersonii.AAC.1